MQTNWNIMRQDLKFLTIHSQWTLEEGVFLFDKTNYTRLLEQCRLTTEGYIYCTLVLVLIRTMVFGMKKNRIGSDSCLSDWKDCSKGWREVLGSSSRGHSLRLARPLPLVTTSSAAVLYCQGASGFLKQWFTVTLFFEGVMWFKEVYWKI